MEYLTNVLVTFYSTYGHVHRMALAVVEGAEKVPDSTVRLRRIAEHTWRQLAGAGALAGIGFTMSLFIAGQAFPSATDFSAAKIAVFAASILSAAVGSALLSGASRQELIEETPQSASMRSMLALMRLVNNEVFG